MSEHGTNSRYTNQRCRCDACRAAHTAWTLDWRRRNYRRYRVQDALDKQRLRDRIAAGDPTVSHGSNSTYNAGCRCEPCTAIASERVMAWQRSKRAETAS